MNPLQNWYQPFFNGLALEMWTKALSPAYTEAEINFIKEVAPLHSSSHILDVPCGFGRHSVAFAKEGYPVTSIDIAEEYIHMLHTTAQTLQLPVTAIAADILTYPLTGMYDMALCLGNSFSYFSYEPLLLFVRKINEVLIKDGTFIIHTGALAESILATFQPKDWMQLDDMLLLAERRYHTEGSVLQSDYRFIKGTQVECKTAYHYVFTLAEIKRLLSEAGFTQVTVYGSLDKTPYQLGDKQAYIVAKK